MRVDLNLPATLYVTTGPIDSGRGFPDGGRPLSWGALREALSTGLVDIGAHTHTHALLDRRPRIEVDLELDVCNARIEDELGVVARHFAYPKALSGSAASESVRRRYLTAAVAGTRPNVPGEVDPWYLQRSPIQVSDDWAGFVRKVEGGMRAEDDLRRLVNTVRYRKKAA